MKASRLLSILLHLQTRGRVPASELAAHLEVSVRTIYRDIEALAAAGVPVYADRGPNGGYQLLDGFRTKLTGLTADEADALPFTGLPAAADQLGMGAFLTAAELKLRAALPPQLRERAERIRERVHVDAPGWMNDGSQPEFLQPIADALWRQRVVEVMYRRWAGDVERALEPLGLVFKAGTWYLVAQHEAVAEPVPRTYRVSRVLRFTATDREFTRPAGFDLAAYWRAEMARFGRYPFQGGEATIRLSAHGRRLTPYLGDVVMRAIEASATEPDADGWVTATLPVETIQYMTHQLLRFGTEVEVLDPPELRAGIAAVARDLVDLYADVSGTC